MGATESTARSNETMDGAATAIATAVAAWGSRQRGRFKMNTDGACHPKYVGNTGVQRGPSGYGGILRDHKGAWVVGFMGFIGESDSLTSEFYGILKGLELLDKRKIKGAILEIDSQAAHEWVTRETENPGKREIIRECWPVIMKCRQLVEKNNIDIQLIGRVGNKYADKLANMAIEREVEYLEINEEEPRNNSSDESSIGAATVIATAAAGVAVAGLAFWGISRMVSNNTDSQETEHHGHGMKQSLVNSPNITPAGGSTQRSTWFPPPPGRFKMNTDGACRPKIVGNSDVQRGPSGYGGILRDHNNAWVGGFMGFIGESDSLTSELYGIIKGLELLDKLEIKEAILETDSQPAHEWVTGETENPGKSEIIRECWPIIKKCRQLVEKNNIDIQLIGRVDNKDADKLANMAIDRKKEYVEINEVPDELKLINCYG